MWRARGGVCSGRVLPKCLGHFWGEAGATAGRGSEYWAKSEGKGGSGPEPGWIVHTENSHLSTSYFIVSISFVHEDQRELDIGWGFLFILRGVGWVRLHPASIWPAGCRRLV